MRTGVVFKVIVIMVMMMMMGDKYIYFVFNYLYILAMEQYPDVVHNYFNLLSRVGLKNIIFFGLIYI